MREVLFIFLSYTAGTRPTHLLPREPIAGKIERSSELQSLIDDIERTRKKLELARQNPQLYGGAIVEYERRIADKEAKRTALLRESEAASGGPRRVKDDFGDPKGAFELLLAVGEFFKFIEKEATFDKEVVGEKLKRIADLLDKYREPKRRQYLGAGHTTFGNYEIELDIPGLPPGVEIVERYDFGGHQRGTQGPHIQYDLVWNRTKPPQGGEPHPLGSGKKDFISLGPQQEFGYRIEGTGKGRKIVYLEHETDD